MLLHGGEMLGNLSHRLRRWPILVPMLAGLFFSIIAVMWVPWERVHPYDASLREALGYGPIWTHQFSDVPGSRIDWSAFLVNLLVIWVICIAAALMLNMSARSE